MEYAPTTMTDQLVSRPNAHSDSGGTDGQMQQAPDPTIENRAALENPCCSASVCPDGEAAGERHDAAGGCGGDGFLLSTVNRAHMAYDKGGNQGAQTEADWQKAVTCH
jgi:hypothetical protein